MTSNGSMPYFFLLTDLECSDGNITPKQVWKLS